MISMTFTGPPFLKSCRFFTIATAKTNASIQNNSGLPQGLAGPLCRRLHERKTKRTRRSTALIAHRGGSPMPDTKRREFVTADASRATLASRRFATALPGSDLHRLIAPALPGAFPHSITSSAAASSVAAWRARVPLPL